MQSGTLHLLIGPVGAGKSTYAQRRVAASPAVFLDLDSWMVRLFGGDPRPSDGVLEWYLERRQRCRDVMWDATQSVLRAGSDVFLEIGLLSRAEREAFYQDVRTAEVTLRVYLLDAPRSVRRERVALRNQSGAPFTQQVPPAFFERASDAWEPPTETERGRWGVVDA